MDRVIRRRFLKQSFTAAGGLCAPDIPGNQ